MGFDTTRFLSAEFASREEAVSLPDLKAWFPEGEPPVWRVRGLTGAELAQVNESVDQARNVEAIAAALVSPDSAEKTGALRRLLGTAGDVPPDLVKRIEMLLLGSVEPACERDLAVRFADAYPVEFYQVTNAILRLTGQGKRLGKPSDSGQTPGSESPSPSATPGAGSSTKSGRTSSRKAT